MKKTVRRIISIFITCCVTCCIAVTASAEEMQSSVTDSSLGNVSRDDIEIISTASGELIPLTNAVTESNEDNSLPTDSDELMPSYEITFEESYSLNNDISNGNDFDRSSTDVSNNRSNEDSPNDLELLSDQGIADLVLADFYTSANEPFPTNEYITFYVKIENHGTAYAYPITLDIFINGKRYSSATYSNGGLNPNQGLLAKVPLGAAVGGTYRITAIVNDGNKINELNYDNNIFEKSYRWVTKKSGISMLTFESATGSYRTTVDTPTQFDFAVANWGPNDIGDDGIPVAFMVNNTYQGQFYAKGPIPAGQARKGSIVLGFRAPGVGEIGLLVDPDKSFPDNDRSDNLITHKITVLPIQATDEISTSVSGKFPMGVKDHGWTQFTYEMKYSEKYATMPNKTRRYNHRSQFATVLSNRPLNDTPYSAIITPINHVQVRSNGSEAVKRFQCDNEVSIWPVGDYILQAYKTNKEIDDVPFDTDSDYYGNFNITVRTAPSVEPVFTNMVNQEIRMSLLP